MRRYFAWRNWTEDPSEATKTTSLKSAKQLFRHATFSFQNDLHGPFYLLFKKFLNQNIARRLMILEIDEDVVRSKAGSYVNRFSYEGNRGFANVAKPNEINLLKFRQNRNVGEYRKGILKGFYNIQHDYERQFLAMRSEGNLISISRPGSQQIPQHRKYLIYTTGTEREDGTIESKDRMMFDITSFKRITNVKAKAVRVSDNVTLTAPSLEV